MTSFLFACDIGAYNWINFCTHKKVTMGSPFMQKILLCRKFFLYAENSFIYAENSFGHDSKQCPWLTSFPFACNISTYNWITFCTHRKVTMGSPFMQKIHLFMQKILLLCRKFFWTWFKTMSIKDGATARLGPPKILKNYFILCISIKKFKYLATKIEVSPPQMFELVQWCS